MRIYLDKDVLPFIGDKPLDTVTRGDCAATQEILEKREAYVMAGKVSRWMRAVFQPSCPLYAFSELGPLSCKLRGRYKTLIQELKRVLGFTPGKSNLG